ncbi:MAG: Flp family type IVb pilin [Candidatus Loosdrechtia sp.]|uniref:Flp family type IVb pilin n=1 Tax=Candidatus Loosdrechtia sp. TaxID=3101272 RepID=UPI003A6085E1|nr:MAG: Flp family type IVb pilin [Candidatus Jettenia sp. AMX2]
MKGKLLQFREKEEGVTVIEYAILAGSIALACVAIIGLVGEKVKGLFQSIIF